MKMVGFQTIGNHGNLEFCGILFDPAQEITIVLIINKDPLAIDTAIVEMIVMIRHKLHITDWHDQRLFLSVGWLVVAGIGLMQGASMSLIIVNQSVFCDDRQMLCFCRRTYAR
jgi:hypothetical protein